MRTFCKWKGCRASYMGDAIIPPGWVNLLTTGVDQPLPASVTLCPEHVRALQAELRLETDYYWQLPDGGAK